jgi:phosphatidylserine/phosphatidylglycerophosphate/cardiolipin synthase-like enzyme
MNKVISNHHINPEIIDLIKNSEKYVVLISPYLYLWKHLKDEIIKCTERKVKVVLIIKDFDKDYSKNKSSVQLNKRMDLLEDTLEEFVFCGVEVYTNESLHTKLYMSEKLSLISSMNLYDWSMKTNQELGVVFDDDDTRKQLNKYVKELKSNSIIYENEDVWDDIRESCVPDRFGNCIRCGKSDIKEPFPSDSDDFIFDLEWEYDVKTNSVNPEKDFEREEHKSNHYLCEDCLPIWKKYGSNVEYPEKYCFVCGEEHKTSVKRPFCKDCTYDRKWNDDEFKKEIQENTEKKLKEYGIDL